MDAQRERAEREMSRMKDVIAEITAENLELKKARLRNLWVKGNRLPRRRCVFQGMAGQMNDLRKTAVSSRISPVWRAVVAASGDGMDLADQGGFATESSSGITTIHLPCHASANARPHRRSAGIPPTDSVEKPF